MRKHRDAVGLAALLLLVGMAGAEAQNVPFPCQIDLNERDEAGIFEIDPTEAIVPPEFRRSFGTFRQRKVCQGRQNVRVNCDAFIANWPFNDRLVASDFTCLINPTPCGIEGEEELDGLAVAATASLQIVPTQASRCRQAGLSTQPTSCGFATIECRLR